jgi:hypothetical protein
MARCKVAQHKTVSDIRLMVASLQQQHEWQAPTMVRDGGSSLCHRIVQHELQLIADALQILCTAGGASQ